MGLFDLFKKKTTDSTFPENELERCLMKAASDGSARKEFYTKLLWAELVVLPVDGASSEEGMRMVEKGTQLRFKILPNGYLPVFTSSNRIYDKGINKGKIPILKIQGQNLFKLVKGSKLILNPYSDCGKEILPNEIESILNGTIFNKPDPIILERNTPIQIRALENAPPNLLTALSEFFKSRPKVIAAHIAQIRMNADEKRNHFLVGIEIENADLLEISKEAGPIAERHIQRGEIIDFLEIKSNSDGISAYLKNEIAPFYIRK